MLDLPAQQLPDLQECKSLWPGEGWTTDGSTSAPESYGGGEGFLQNHDCRLQAFGWTATDVGYWPEWALSQRHHRTLLIWLHPASAHSEQSLSTRPSLLPYTQEVWNFWSVLWKPAATSELSQGAASSKGSSAVISYLHYLFEADRLGEKTIDLHCDNCSGQNKNHCMLCYFAWCAMTRKHVSVTFNFMPPGHTNFTPDWCFGLLKRKFKRTKVLMTCVKWFN